MVDEAELPRATPSNVYVPSAEEILEDAGMERMARLFDGSEAKALAKVGRWIEEEAYEFQDATARTGIAEFYKGDIQEKPFSNEIMVRIKTAISYRVKVRLFAFAIAREPQEDAYIELHRAARDEAATRTANLHATSAHPHVEGVYVPDRFPRAIGPTNTGTEEGRDIDDGKDQSLWDTTNQEDDNI